MKKHLLTGIFAIVFLISFVPAFAQFTPEEVAERPKWEEFLRAAMVVKEEQMVGPESVTSPWHLTLELDGVTKDAFWKDIQGRVKGFIEGWKYEIAAYQFDKYLGLNMVPPTIEKEFHSNRGSCQLGVTYWKSLKKVQEEKIKKPSYKIFGYNRAINLQRTFDNLIGNEDRHLNNYLIMEDWRVILIDHSRTFRTSGKWTKELPYGEKNREGLVMKEMPKAVFEKIKALNAEVIKGFVGDNLTDEEINAVLARKELIIKQIESLVQKNGEANVLYEN
jgi:hypothetical protein